MDLHNVLGTSSGDASSDSSSVRSLGEGKFVLKGERGDVTVSVIDATFGGKVVRAAEFTKEQTQQIAEQFEKILSEQKAREFITGKDFKGCTITTAPKDEISRSVKMVAHEGVFSHQFLYFIAQQKAAQARAEHEGIGKHDHVAEERKSLLADTDARRSSESQAATVAAPPLTETKVAAETKAKAAATSQRQATKKKTEDAATTALKRVFLLGSAIYFWNKVVSPKIKMSEAEWAKASALQKFGSGAARLGAAGLSRIHYLFAGVIDALIQGGRGFRQIYRTYKITKLVQASADLSAGQKLKYSPAKHTFKMIGKAAGAFFGKLAQSVSMFFLGTKGMFMPKKGSRASAVEYLHKHVFVHLNIVGINTRLQKQIKADEDKNIEVSKRVAERDAKAKEAAAEKAAKAAAAKAKEASK